MTTSNEQGNFQPGARQEGVVGERGYPREPSEGSPVETIPTSVPAGDILAASKKYGTDWEAK
jgi:hypothetical protein